MGCSVLKICSKRILKLVSIMGYFNTQFTDYFTSSVSKNLVTNNSMRRTATNRAHRLLKFNSLNNKSRCTFCFEELTEKGGNMESALTNSIFIKYETNDDTEYNTEENSSYNFSGELKEQFCSTENYGKEDGLNDKPAIKQEFIDMNIKPEPLKIEEFDIKDEITSSPPRSPLEVCVGQKHFACRVCEYKSSERSKMRRHMMIHTGEKPFECKTCNYKCSESSKLSRHMRTHTGEKPYQCKMCDYKCSRSSQLKVHARFHTGEKPFVCKLCQYKCSGGSNLRRHLRIHIKKLHECKICDDSFAEESQLTRHIRIHNGEKPYQCEMCDYKSSNKTRLQDHILTHTGLKPFNCKICGSNFSLKSNLQRHIKIHDKYQQSNLNFTKKSLTKDP